METVIKAESIFIQTEFPESAEKLLRRSFNLQEDERIICAVWLSRILCRGFVVTDKKCLWRVMSYTGAEKRLLSGAIDRRQDAQVAVTVDKVLSESAQGSPGKNAPFVIKLSVTSGENSASFYFSSLTESRAAILKDVLFYAFKDGSVPQIDLGEDARFVKQKGLRRAADEVTMFFASAGDTANSFKSRVRQKFSSVKNTFSARRNKARPEEEKSAPKETDAAHKSARKKKTNTLARKISRAFAYLVDFLAGLVFVSALVIALKPDLFCTVKYIECYENKNAGAVSARCIDLENAGHGHIHRESGFMSLGIFKVSEKILPLNSGNIKCEAARNERNVFVFFALAAYLLLKLAVTALARGPQKIVSVLMTVMMILLCLLTKFSLWIPAVFALIVYVSFALSCGFSVRAIARKFAVLVFASAVLYVEAHILLDYNGIRCAANEFTESIISMISALRIELN